MAKINSIFRISGTVGDFVFYDTKYGTVVRQRPQRNKRSASPASVRVQQQCNEFKTAGKAVQLIRSAFHPLLKDIRDSTLQCRMMSTMMKVLQSDNVHERGFRTP